MRKPCDALSLHTLNFLKLQELQDLQDLQEFVQELQDSCNLKNGYRQHTALINGDVRGQLIRKTPSARIFRISGVRNL